MEPSDQSLLQRYVSHGDEEAFAELVKRHGGLIFSLALRRIGNRSLAEEVTQNLFALLARKGGALVHHPALLAWMQKAAHYQAERAAAREGNRQRLMLNYYANISMERSGNGDPTTLEGHWPLLDAAMAALPEADRQILLLRFWSKAPYKAIAESVGSSVQACEKRAMRALDRMGRFLRQRGVVLPAVAITACLNQSAAQAALPASLSSVLTPATLKAAPLMAGAKKLMLLTIMKSKITFIAVAILAFGLAGFTGWSAARSRQDFSTESRHVAAPVGLSGIGRTAPISAASPAAEHRRTSLETLLRQAREALQRGKIDLTAGDFAAAKISQIDFADIPEALRMIEVGAGFRADADLTALLLTRWAEHDGAKACEFSLKLPQPSLGLPAIMNPLRTWAALNPQEAYGWFKAHSRDGKAVDPSPKGEWTPISSIRWIMGEWALRDSGAVARVIAELDDKAQLQGAITGLSEAAAQAANRTEIMDAVAAKFPAEKASERWSDMRNLMERWSAVRPQELAAWIDRQGVAPSSDTMVNQPVLKAWLVQDSVKAVDWWLNRPGGYPERSTKLRSLMEAWVPTDVYAAAAWLATQPHDDNAADAISVLTLTLKETDPESAYTWARAITSESLRSAAMSNAIQAWHSKDPAAAERALAEANFTDTERAAIEQSFSIKKP